jgi:hypothetical protein
MNKSAPSTISPPDPFKLLGSIEIGVDISLVLIGVLTLQLYFYFEHYRNDRRRIQTMVCLRSINAGEKPLNPFPTIGFGDMVCGP